ncbi:hypothetical protein FOCC_FOCC017198 [Frankliniella occidentalis]|nr:hypothetical protein FOCC_FOCC017198 [Frankliniella occidentalis]
MLMQYSGFGFSALQLLLAVVVAVVLRSLGNMDLPPCDERRDEELRLVVTESHSLRDRAFPCGREYRKQPRPALTVRSPTSTSTGAPFESDVEIKEEKIAVPEDGADEQLGLVVAGCYSLHRAEADGGRNGGHEDEHREDGEPEEAENEGGSGNQDDGEQERDRVRKKRVPSGRKTYECGECKKRCNSKSNLTMHVRIHTGEKPFKCGICKMRFNQKSNLISHVKIHTGEKLYNCDICSKGFIYKCFLDRHVRTHSGEKSFECDVCKIRFVYKSSLVKHVRKSHSYE